MYSAADVVPQPKSPTRRQPNDDCYNRTAAPWKKRGGKGGRLLIVVPSLVIWYSALRTACTYTVVLQLLCCTPYIQNGYSPPYCTPYLRFNWLQDCCLGEELWYAGTLGCSFPISSVAIASLAPGNGPGEGASHRRAAAKTHCQIHASPHVRCRKYTYGGLLHVM